jgi:Spy/CpxP family protein refolding chaperone
MTRRNFQIVFYFLLVFLSGSVVGGLAYRTYNPPSARGSNISPTPGEWRRQYMEESRVRLGLTDEQMAKLNAIMDQTDARFREQHEHENEMVNEIRQDHIARVRSILNPDQLPKYEQLHAERVARQEQEQQRKH